MDWGWLLLIATLSFFLSGLPYYPFLNSDIAVHVLMTESFSFRYDLYFWGQDRLGSLVPMMANVLYRITGASPFWLTAIVKWLFLVIGCVSFWLFIPNRFQRWVWTCIWFFPAYEMMYHLLPGHPYAEQMAMFGLSLLFFHRAVNASSFSWNVHLFLLFASTSFWISDFSLIFYLVLIGLFSSKFKLLFQQILSNPLKARVFSFLILNSLVFCFLLVAKVTAARDETYTVSMFASLDQLFYSLSMLWFYTKNVLIFQSVSIWNSVYFYSTLIMLFILIGNRNRLKIQVNSVLFFSVAFCGSLLIISLRWLAINFVMLKYFIPVFFCLWLGLLSVDWNRISFSFKSIAITLMMLLVIGCSASLFYQYQHPSEKNLNYTELQTPFFQTPKNIIGDYWYSYVFAISQPEIIHATPHDLSSVRNWKEVKLVMNSDTIHVCLTGWMEEAPERLEQFNTELELIDTIKEGQFNFARYKKRDSF